MTRSNGFRFSDALGFRVPDNVHFICEDCALRKRAEPLGKLTYMKTLCDLCDHVKYNVSLATDWNFAEYGQGDKKVKEWKKKRSGKSEE